MFRRIFSAALVLWLAIVLGISGIAGFISTPSRVVFSASLPDLVIEDITWSPTFPSIGDVMTFTVTIKNQGGSAASTFSVAYYLDNTYLTSATVNLLDPGATVTGTFNWTAQAGAHEIKAVADQDNRVTESDEMNNEKGVSFSVLVPDLIIESITWSPASPSKGDSVTFNVTVKNQGKGRAGAFRVYFYLDGASRGYEEVPRLEAGASVTKSFTWVAQAGAHEIKAVADKDNQVLESDEANNEKIVAFAPLTPDLIIESITWSPTSPSVGDNVTFTVVIKNQGTGRADYSTVAYYIDDTYLDAALVNPISANTSDNKTLIWPAQSGLHNIKAVADYLGKVVESDETNNEKTVPFNPAPPDLYIVSVTWLPESPSIGDVVTFTVTMKNQGTGKAGAFRVYFFLDDSVQGYQEIQELGVGTTVVKTFTWEAKAGAHNIKVVVDKESQVAESDETNNEKTVTFSGLLLADLVIDAITWTPENASIGGTVIFKVTIKNQGTGKADYSYVAYYIDNVYFDSAYVNPLSANTTDNKTFSWMALPGTHEIKAIADSNIRIIENNEANNEKTVIFSTSAPDLIVQTIAWSPVSPVVGDTVTFNVTIKNQGNLKAGFSLVHFYLDGALIAFQDVAEIEGGASVTRSFTWRAQAGAHNIRAVADEPNHISENNETNNERRMTIPAPDLIARGITWSPENPLESDNVTFTVTVENRGGGKADAFRIYFYTDNATPVYAEVLELEASANVTRAFLWVAQAGIQKIKVVADETNSVTESDEANNEKIVTFYILSEAPAPAPPPATTPPAPAPGPKPPRESVYLSAPGGKVSVGEDIVFDLSASNLITNHQLTVELNLEIPAGLSVVSTEFSQDSQGRYTASYTVASGEIRKIAVRLKANQPVTANITAQIAYYFGEDKANAEQQRLSLPVTVDAAKAPVRTPIPAPVPEKGIGAGWWFIVAAVVLGVLLFLALRAR